MPKLSDDSLLKRAIEDAVSDRDSFSEAYSRTGAESDKAVALISKIRALKDKSFKTMTDNDLLIARQTFLYAEQWRDGLAQAQINAADRKFSCDWARRFREVRMRKWGKTKLEHILDTTRSISLFDRTAVENMMAIAPRITLK